MNSFSWMITFKNFHQLIPDSFSANLGKQISVFYNPSKRFFFYLERQLSCKTNRPHHSQSVFCKPLLSISNCFDQPVLKIFQSSQIIKQLIPTSFLFWANHYRIHSEIPPANILLKTLSPFNLIWSASVSVASLGSVRSNLVYLLSFSLKCYPNRSIIIVVKSIQTLQNLKYLFWSSTGRKVTIHRLLANQHQPNPRSNHIDLITFLVK